MRARIASVAGSLVPSLPLFALSLSLSRPPALSRSLALSLARSLAHSIARSLALLRSRSLALSQLLSLWPLLSRAPTLSKGNSCK